MTLDGRSHVLITVPSLRDQVPTACSEDLENQSGIGHVSWEKADRSGRVLKLKGARKEGQRLVKHEL